MNSNIQKISKVVGIFLCIGGTYGILSGLGKLFEFLKGGDSFTVEEIILFITMVEGYYLISLIVGFGLVKSKLWAVYGLAFLAVFRIAGLMWAATEATITTGNLAMVGLYILSFIWFYSNKKEFAK